MNHSSNYGGIIIVIMPSIFKVGRVFFLHPLLLLTRDKTNINLRLVHVARDPNYHQVSEEKTFRRLQKEKKLMKKLEKGNIMKTTKVV